MSRKIVKSADSRLSRAIAAAAQQAVKRLVALMDNENPETARKACMDLIQLYLTAGAGMSEPTDCGLDEQEAAAMLEALAQARERVQRGQRAEPAAAPPCRPA